MGLILDCNPGDLVMYRERVDAPWSAARVYAVGHSGDAAQPWTTLLTLTLLDESGAATGETRFVNDAEFPERVRQPMDAERADFDHRERCCASAYLHCAVEHAMVALYARCNLIPATATGYEMIRNEIACALGDLRSDAVKVEPRPPGFRVTWNGVDCTWLGMRTRAPVGDGDGCYDATQRPVRTASVGIVDSPGATQPDTDPASVAAMAAVGPGGAFIEWRGVVDPVIRTIAPPSITPTSHPISVMPCRANAEAFNEWRGSPMPPDDTTFNNWPASTPPLRPDGFSQAAIDAAKAVLLAPVAKRGGR